MACPTQRSCCKKRVSGKLISVVLGCSKPNLIKAQMTDVQFGVLPLLKQDAKVRLSVYSPDENLWSVLPMAGSMCILRTTSRTMTLWYLCYKIADALTCVTFVWNGREANPYCDTTGQM